MRVTAKHCRSRTPSIGRWSHAPRARAPDVDRAVKAAAAFPIWRQVPPRERGHELIKIADAMERDPERLARLLAPRLATRYELRRVPKFAAPSISLLFRRVRQ